MKDQLKGLQKNHGNIDVLSNRISNVRTWAYIANKKNWVENSDYWIQLTKKIEDDLSDRLHEELTRSFIDKKISILSRGLKQDVELKTEVNDEDKVLIDGQFIGQLKGLKFNIEFTSNNLEADLKSIKKAARKGIHAELVKRVALIIQSKQISYEEDNKIYWNKNPIARIRKGNDYLNPEVEIIADDALPNELSYELEVFLKNWLLKHIKEILGDLINLTKNKEKNQYLRALAFQMYENNGVIKREEINHMIKLISKEERKKLWGMGIKLGRYHVYLPKMLKPKAVTLRVSLWKLFYDLSSNTNIPKFGLNFIEDKKLNKKFLLLCGFENFRDFFVRVDILEKLFINILDKSVNRKFKINSEMMNLLGCTKENFNLLLNLMNYKKEKDKDYFIFMGDTKKNKKIFKIKKISSPFEKLLSLNIK
jgi:ATP-dependent RNA helicase SUPV3L1/SUV3